MRLYIIILEQSPGPILGVYIERELYNNLMLLLGECIPWKRVFFGGYNALKNGAWKFLGVRLLHVKTISK